MVTSFFRTHGRTTPQDTPSEVASRQELVLARNHIGQVGGVKRLGRCNREGRGIQKTMSGLSHAVFACVIYSRVCVLKGLFRDHIPVIGSCMLRLLRLYPPLAPRIVDLLRVNHNITSPSVPFASAEPPFGTFHHGPGSDTIHWESKHFTKLHPCACTRFEGVEAPGSLREYSMTMSTE